MKKSFIAITFLILIFTTLVTSEQIPVLGIEEDQLTDAKDTVGNILDVAQSDNKGEVIEQHWKNIRENTTFGESLNKSEDFMKKFDPIFKFLLGLGFSWSMLFILTLVLWVFVTSNLTRLLEPLTSFSKILRILISITFSILVSLLGITKILAEYMINAILLLPHWMFQILAGAAVLILLMFFSISSKLIQTSSIRARRERRIAKAERNAKEAKQIARRPQRKSREQEIKEMARSELRGLGKDDS